MDDVRALPAATKSRRAPGVPVVEIAKLAATGPLLGLALAVIGRRWLPPLKSTCESADDGRVTVDDLPPLTGSVLLDPWRIRLRLALAGELEPPARQAPTRSEQLLWDRLQNDSPEWIREYATGPYRLDFYCPSVKLAIEIDGSSHWGQSARKRDDLRDDWHALRGIVTKRFSAREVESEPDWVHTQVLGFVAVLGEVASTVTREPADAMSSVANASQCGDCTGIDHWVDTQRAAACETVLPDPAEGRRRLRQFLHRQLEGSRAKDKCK